MKIPMIIALALTLIGGCTKSNNEPVYVPYTYNESSKEISGANTKYPTEENKTYTPSRQANTSWIEVEEIDKLTGAKTPTVQYSPRIAISGYPDASIELIGSCTTENTIFFGNEKYNRVVYRAPKLRIRVIDAPDLILRQYHKRVLDWDFLLIGSYARGILRNGTVMANWLQRSESFSNEFFMELFGPEIEWSEVVGKILKVKDGQSEIDLDSANKRFKDEMKSVIPTKLELAFNQGTTFIVGFDETYREFNENCLQIEKLLAR